MAKAVPDGVTQVLARPLPLRGTGKALRSAPEVCRTNAHLGTGNHPVVDNRSLGISVYLRPVPAIPLLRHDRHLRQMTPLTKNLRSSWKGYLRCSKSAVEFAVQISGYRQNRHLEDTVIATRVSWNDTDRCWKRIESDMLAIKKATGKSHTGTNRISEDAVSAAE